MTDFDGKVIFRWTPTEADRIHPHDDLATEYVVAEFPEAAAGIIIYANYRGEWQANPWTARPLVRHLLKLLEEKNCGE